MGDQAPLAAVFTKRYARSHTRQYSALSARNVKGVKGAGEASRLPHPAQDDSSGRLGLTY